MINPHAILLSIVGDMRKTALAAGWMDQFGPDGALYDNGLAVWEMLPGQPGGYNNAIHELAGPQSQVQLQLLFTPQILPQLLTTQEIVHINAALHNAPYATLDLAELAAVQSPYYAGNSLAFQNLVACPQRVGAPSAKSRYVPYDYAAFPTVLDTVALAAKGGNRTVSTYLNVGLANNLGFFTNAMGYEIRYGQLHFVPTGAQLFINAAMNPASELSIVEIPVQLFWGAPIRHKWFRAVLDITHPVVVGDALDSIRSLVRRYGSVTKFFIGGEATSGFTAEKPECYEPITAANCRTCRPVTNYAPHAVAAFREYMWRKFAGPDAVRAAAINARWNIPSAHQYRKDLIRDNGPIFTGQGRAVAEVAGPDVRVMVVGNPCNTNCLIAMHNAKGVAKERFTAMTRLDQNRAQSQLAKKANAAWGDVKNVVIWGNHSNTQFPDWHHATIAGKPVSSLIKDETWLKETFIKTVQERGAAVIKQRGSSSAFSAANAAIDHCWSLFHATKPGEWTSLCVLSDGSYGIEAGIICSFPCTTDGKGNWKIVQGLALNDFAKGKIKVTVDELIEERAAIRDLLG